MTLQLFADESGTHHPQGAQPGSEVPVIAGYMARRDAWKRFLCDWDSILKRYGVKTFHAKDFRSGVAPYYSWDLDKSQSFRYALAEVAGRQIPIGGAYNIKEHHRKNPADETYLYRHSINHFFIDLVDAIKEWGYEREKISITFDNGTSKKWNAAIIDQIEYWKKNGLRILTHTYGDDEALTPLQAADLFAHRSRELQAEKLSKQAEIFNKTGNATDVRVIPNVFDIMLNRNLRPKIGFTPIITPDLAHEISILSKKHSSVRRALSEVPNNYFKLK